MRRFLTHSLCASVFLLLLIATSCDHETSAGAPILDETEGIDYDIYDRYIDKHGNRGIVAYIEKDKYIMVVSSDEAYLPWGKMGQTVTPTFDYIGNEHNAHQYGVAILLSMKNIGIEYYPAQKWCDDKNNGDEIYAGSWHIPSPAELIAITRGIPEGDPDEGLQKLSDMLDLFYKNPLTDDQYWTCLEDLKGAAGVHVGHVIGLAFDSDNRARSQFLPSRVDETKGSWYKKEKHYVRAVKYIYFNNSWPY